MEITEKGIPRIAITTKVMVSITLRARMQSGEGIIRQIISEQATGSAVNNRSPDCCRCLPDLRRMARGNAYQPLRASYQ